MENKTVKLSEIETGKTFIIGDIEFIKFFDENGETAVVSKDVLFESEFGKDNDFANSKVFDRLVDEVLTKLEKEIGAENIVEFETDLTTLDGLKPYPEFRSKISLPTFDFYRKYVNIFDNYKVNRWWWLSTPESAKPHYDPIWIVCVSPSGVNDCNIYILECGVRPFLRFVSSISVSRVG